MDRLTYTYYFSFKRVERESKGNPSRIRIPDKAEVEVSEYWYATHREKRIAGKLSEVMSIARRNEGLLTEESVDIYLKYNLKSLSDVADMLDGEIYCLSKFKLIVQSRKLKECGAKE